MAVQVRENEGTAYSAALWIVKSGQEEAFLERWKEFARWTAEHLDGVVSVVLVQDIANPNIFITLGPWKDMASMTRWRETAAFAEAFRDFRELCDRIEPHTMRSVFSLTG